MAVNKQIIKFLFLLSVLGLFGQETSIKITIEFIDEPIAVALAKLDNSIAQQLSYNPQILPQNTTITRSFEDQIPEVILVGILGPTYQLKNIGNYIIIQKAPLTKKEKTAFQLKGGIKDASSGKDLSGVSVYEINSLKSTLSNEQGKFELQANTEFKEATFVVSRRFYQDTIIRITKPEQLTQPIALKQEEPSKKGIMIRERVKVFSSGLAKFFTSIELRKNAQNVNFVDTRLFQLSLVPSIGTNRKMSGQIKNKISLNLISGYSYGVHGVELGGFYNLDREEVIGAQFGGFGNTVGGEVRGAQFGGFINTTKDYVNGVQMAGFINVASDSVEGFQAAGFTNTTKEMSGFQVAGFNNRTMKVSGYQLSGFMNTTGEMDGVQIAGFINIAKEVKGLQLSVINIADTVSSGVPIGLISIVKKNGFLSPALEYTDAIPVGFAMRVGVETFYSILAIGTNPDNYWSVGGGFGSKRFTSVNRKLFLNPELRWSSLTQGKIRENEDSNLIQLNFNLGYQLFKRLSIAGDPSLNFFFTNHLNAQGDPIIDLANSTIIDGQGSRNRYQMWAGYTLNIGF